jgi:ribosomal protein S18 acetylase RimI-like enzyme
MNKPIISLFWSQIDAEKPNAVYIHARYQSGGVVGQLRLETNDKAGWIGSLFVNPEHRGKGLATLLINYAFAICRRFEFESVGLNVKHENTNAQRLYKSLGFVGFTDSYDGYQQYVKVLTK